LKKIVLGQQVQELCHNRCQSMSLTQNSLGVQWPEPHFSGQCYRIQHIDGFIETRGCE